MSPKVLVLHGLRTDSRLTTVLNTLSFGRHASGLEVYFASVYGPLRIAGNVLSTDVLIMTYEALALRTSPMWSRVVRRVRPVLRNTR